MLDQVLATRYVAPLREGGSLPGIVEAADLGTYVMKFRGAGQGTKALVDILEVILRYRERTVHPELRPEGSLPVSILAYGFPIQPTPSDN